MIELTYLRDDVENFKEFKSPAELIKWLIDQSDNEPITVLSIKEKSKLFSRLF